MPTRPAWQLGHWLCIIERCLSCKRVARAKYRRAYACCAPRTRAKASDRRTDTRRAPCTEPSHRRANSCCSPCTRTKASDRRADTRPTPTPTPTPTPGPTPTPTPSPPTNTTANITASACSDVNATLALHNTYRVVHQAANVTWNATLAAFAQVSCVCVCVCACVCVGPSIRQCCVLFGYVTRSRSVMCDLI